MRTCIILVPGLSGRLLDRLKRENTPSWLTELAHEGRAVIRPVLPAVTMTVQATYTTGVIPGGPGGHGMVANGVAPFHNPELLEHLDLTSHAEYRRTVSFWEQSNKLLAAPRLWRKDGRRAAMLFVQSSMSGAADVVVTPKPTHTPDGKTISMCWSDPPGLYEKLAKQLGPFPLHHYWGPLAGLKSSEWIAAAARIVWETHPCDLQWTYIPQLDYDLQRWGPDDPRCAESLSQALALLSPLVEKVRADGGRLRVIGEYGMTAVNRSAAPNVALREAGLLKVGAGCAMDYQASRAFAICDHQVAHVYCRDEQAAEEAEEILRGLPEVQHTYRGPRRAEVGLDTDRAGEVVAFTQTDAWFEYRWWSDWSEAPPFAWTVDIHAKPGYDPTELFADPATRRIRADQPQLVKGSHGALPENELDWPVLLGAAPAVGKIDAARVAEAV